MPLPPVDSWLVPITFTPLHKERYCVIQVYSRIQNCDPAVFQPRIQPANFWAQRSEKGYTEAYQVTLKCIKYNSISISLFSPIGISFFKYYNSPINLLLTVSIF